MNNIPQWFIDQQIEQWAKAHNVRKEPDLESGVLEYELLAILQKALTPPKIDVHVFTTEVLSEAEEGELKLAIRECTRFYLPYVNLIFQKLEKIKEFKKETFKSKKGLNVVIVPDNTLDELRGKNLNGVMLVEMNTAVLELSLLSEEDSRNRTTVNAFAATLIHELMHWFGNRLEERTDIITDRTHYFDYEFTLANYLPELCWGRIHDEQFRLAFNL